jgi:hypothetical protein
MSPRLTPSRLLSGCGDEGRIDLEGINKAAFPGPYLELYARKAVPGWACWADAGRLRHRRRGARQRGGVLARITIRGAGRNNPPGLAA